MCALARLDATVVPLEGAGCLVVTAAVGAAGEAGERLSRVLGNADVVVVRRWEDRVDAERWRAGAVAEAPAAGLLLSNLPDVAERVLLGAAPGDQPGAVSTAGLSRLAAARAAVAGSPAEATWTARARRWSGLAAAVAAALLFLAAGLLTVQAAGGGGAWWPPALTGLAAVALASRAVLSRRSA